MAGSVNKVILVGNLGKDPEIRTTQNGDKVASFSIATSERWKDKSGQPQEKTEWHRIAVFNDRLVDVIQKYVHKGSKVYIEGALQTRKWTDKEGQERYTTEVVLSKFRGELTMLDSKGSGAANDYGGAQESDGGYESAPAKRVSSGSSTPVDELEDEIPF